MSTNYNLKYSSGVQCATYLSTQISKYLIWVVSATLVEAQPHIAGFNRRDQAQIFFLVGYFFINFNYLTVSDLSNSFPVRLHLSLSLL